ncbi:putative dehydrogenase [Gaiella occulta]|uniref:Putative dehydrogenase n=1 Tax=Gaiella occulta TaxID=1002870 RepID=A0A7M2Z062_9ACTN|nr:L-2-hydroxyglutarate oxidase [Gaiella occulta]RDI75404.1 putative dehydrogenase [Gaiella occulta]
MDDPLPAGTAAAADRRADVAVIGAGIVGLSTARLLALRHPRLRIVVLDKEQAIARHQTGRNSGVIHSGIYYAPGSLKAELCVRGAAALSAYCDEKGIPTLRCGKVVVARLPQELPRLEELHRRGVANGVAGLELIGRERLRELEPHVAGVRALHVPGTGVVDYGRVASAYAEDFAAAGGEVLLGREVTGIRRVRGRVLLETGAGSVEARHVVACAGVYADRVARLGGGDPEPRIVPFRGDYYALKPERRHLVNALVYPVPDPGFPFLGIHTTLRVDGSVLLGPNAVLAFAREGYGRFDVSLGDLAETLRAPGFRRIARRYWRTGLGETVRDYSKRLFVASARRLIPELEPSDVVPGPAGIRAQALAADGTLVDDFVLEHRDGAIHVRNAPSPGATSSLAIAERLSDLAGEAFGL